MGHPIVGFHAGTQGKTFKNQVRNFGNGKDAIGLILQHLGDGVGQGKMTVEGLEVATPGGLLGGGRSAGIAFSGAFGRVDRVGGWPRLGAWGNGGWTSARWVCGVS